MGEQPTLFLKVYIKCGTSKKFKIFGNIRRHKKAGTTGQLRPQVCGKHRPGCGKGQPLLNAEVVPPKKKLQPESAVLFCGLSRTLKILVNNFICNYVSFRFVKIAEFNFFSLILIDKTQKSMV